MSSPILPSSSKVATVSLVLGVAGLATGLLSIFFSVVIFGAPSWGPGPGLLGLLLPFVPLVLAILLMLAAIILGVMGLRSDRRGLASCGILTGGVPLLAAVVVVAVAFLR